MEIIISATRINAEVLNQSGTLGEITEGAVADLLVLDGNPADDISVLTVRNRIKLIVKDGRIVKNTL